NHTMMTLNMCKKYGIRVLGLVINQTDPDGYDLTDLEDDLVLLSGVEILCKIPHIQSGDIKLATEILQQNSVISRL
ncbi:MAG: AAA family ATPase, partial [Candidatus Nitrosotenuis sp.]